MSVLKNYASKNLKILAVLLILFLMAIFYGSGEMKEEEKLEVEGYQSLSVSISVAERTVKSNELWFTGTVEGFTSAIISSKYSDQVQAVYVENGQRVKRGEQLFTIDIEELENNLCLAESDVVKAEVNEENSRVNYERKQNLFEVGAVSKETLETAAVQWRTRVAETEDAKIKRQIAQKKLQDATVTSPVNGVIANKKVTVGQMVSAGSQLMTVEETDSVYVTVKVEQQFISKMQVGTNAKVQIDSLPEKIFAGKVAVINPVAGVENRLFEVKVLVDNPEFLLMPGMFAEVLIEEGEKSSVLTIPRTALISHKGQNYVYVVSSENQVQRQHVEIGELLDDKVEIISGVNEGDKVVTDNIDKLKDGDVVNVVGGGNS